MKKGFTLVELIAVVTLIALISILALPPILNSINQKKGELSDAMTTIIHQATSLYINDYASNYPSVEGNVYCITLQELVNGNYLSNPITDPTTKKVVPLTTYVKASRVAGEFTYEIVKTCESRN